MSFQATFYDGKSSRSHVVVVHPAAAHIEIRFESSLRRAHLRFDRASTNLGSRLGNTPRAINLPEGAKLETEDNEAVDRLATSWGHSHIRPHLFESNIALAFAAVVLVGLLSVAGFIWGVPMAAKHIAYSIPDEAAYKLGEGTLSTLDKLMFKPSQLSEERREELEEGFSKMAAHYPRLPLHLEFRLAKMPNAFALPNGTVVVTDELVEMAETDEEIYSVLAHEIGHVEYRHTARIALEGSAVALMAMVILGDASQAAGVLSALPAVYANAQFSQDHETEADNFALEYMKNSGLDPAAFANILERMTAEMGATPAFAQYMSSHPATKKRIARFRGSQ